MMMRIEDRSVDKAVTYMQQEQRYTIRDAKQDGKITLNKFEFSWLCFCITGKLGRENH